MQSPSGRMAEYGRRFGGSNTRKPRNPKHLWQSECEIGTPSRARQLDAIDFQRKLRKNQTNAERRTKKALLRLYGLPEDAKREVYKEFFVDQYIVWIGKKPLFVDFLLVKGKIAIEIDGEYHHTWKQGIKDQCRTKQLNHEGIRVRRIDNHETRHQPTLDKFLSNCRDAGLKRLGMKLGPIKEVALIIRKRNPQSIPTGATMLQPGVYARFK